MENKKTFLNIIKEFVNPDKIFITDGECVDEVDDYKDIIEDLFKLTNEELRLQKFKGVEGTDRSLDPETDKIVPGNDREICLTVDNKEYSFYVECDYWIDNVNFVKGLNKIFVDKKSDNRFYFFWASDSFGQEIGFFYSKMETGKAIMDMASTENESAEGESELWQISDGEKEEGFEEL